MVSRGVEEIVVGVLISHVEIIGDHGLERMTKMSISSHAKPFVISADIKEKF